MKKLILAAAIGPIPSVPNVDNIFQANPLPNSSFGSLGSTLTSFYEVLLFVVIVLALIWLTWGAFQYITAGGDKEALAKARSRITWAVVGLLIFVTAFLIAQFASEIFPSRGGINF